MICCLKCVISCSVIYTLSTCITYEQMSWPSYFAIVAYLTKQHKMTTVSSHSLPFALLLRWNSSPCHWRPSLFCTSS